MGYYCASLHFPAFEKAFGPAAQGIFGAGGVNPETPEMKAYFKDHLEVTGVAADFWASRVTYASLQVLEQAIERAGTIDHPSVIKTLKNGSFDTVMGKMTFDGNINRKFWTMGQWQDGLFYGVASTGMGGEKEPIMKTGWE